MRILAAGFILIAISIVMALGDEPATRPAASQAVSHQATMPASGPATRGALPAEISISSQLRWWLSIFPDGSGKVQYGSSFTVYRVFPAGTFDYAETYRLLVRTVKPEAMPSGAAVCFLAEGENTVHAKYTPDWENVERIFTKALRAGKSPLGSDLGSDRLDEILKENPIVPEGVKVAGSNPAPTQPAK